MISYIANLHYDLSLEKKIIGTCFNEGSRFSEIRVMISAEHFYLAENKIFFEAMNELWNKGFGIDTITVNNFILKNRLGDNYSEPVTKVIYDYSEGVNNSGNFLNWAFILRELFIERQLLIIQTQATLGDGDGISKMVALQKKIEKALAIKNVDDWQDMSRVMMALQEHQGTASGKHILGLPTGFKTLDRITFGLQPGDVTVIGARPSVGKSAFAAALSLNAAYQGNNIGVITLEMSKVQIAARMASLYTNKEFWRVYRAKFTDEAQEQQLYKQQQEMSKLPIYISDKTNVNTGDIRAKATKLHERVGLKGLIIDYIQLIEGDSKSDNREREVAKISRGMKLLAMDLEIPVIILAQLNKDSEKEKNKKPRLTNIRESDTLGQDASNVFLLHRDWKAGIHKNEKGESTEYQADIIVEKNRNGECIEIPICFEPETMKFYEKDAAQATIFQSANTAYIPDEGKPIQQKILEDPTF